MSTCLKLYPFVLFDSQVYYYTHIKFILDIYKKNVTVMNYYPEST